MFERHAAHSRFCRCPVVHIAQTFVRTPVCRMRVANAGGDGDVRRGQLGAGARCPAARERVARRRSRPWWRPAAPTAAPGPAPGRPGAGRGRRPGLRSAAGAAGGGPGVGPAGPGGAAGAAAGARRCGRARTGSASWSGRSAAVPRSTAGPGRRVLRRPAGRAAGGRASWSALGQLLALARSRGPGRRRGAGGHRLGGGPAAAVVTVGRRARRCGTSRAARPGGRRARQRRAGRADRRWPTRLTSVELRPGQVLRVPSG